MPKRVRSPNSASTVTAVRTLTTRRLIKDSTTGRKDHVATAWWICPSRPATESVMEGCLELHSLYITADAGLRWRNGVLHRQPQPDRPWLDRMEGGLDADSFAIRDASAVRAVAVTISLSGAAGSARVTRSVGAASLKGGRTCLRRS